MAFRSCQVSGPTHLALRGTRGGQRENSGQSYATSDRYGAGRLPFHPYEKFIFRFAISGGLVLHTVDAVDSGKRLVKCTVIWETGKMKEETDAMRSIPLT